MLVINTKLSLLIFYDAFSKSYPMIQTKLLCNFKPFPFLASCWSMFLLIYCNYMLREEFRWWGMEGRVFWSLWGSPWIWDFILRVKWFFLISHDKIYNAKQLVTIIVGYPIDCYLRFTISLELHPKNQLSKSFISNLINPNFGGFWNHS